MDRYNKYITNDNHTIIYSKKRKVKLNNQTGELLFYCTKCKLYLPVNHFEFKWNNSKTEKNNLRTDCKKCRTEESRLYHYYRRRKFTEEYAEKRMLHLDRLKHDLQYHTKIVLLLYAKLHAKKINTEFSLSTDDLVIPDKCPILNKPFILHDKKYTYSIDRIDNSKGYIKGNICIISRLANMMKNWATNEELITFSENIVSYIKRLSKLHV